MYIKAKVLDYQSGEYTMKIGDQVVYGVEKDNLGMGDFVEKLENNNITVEDFTGYIGQILDGEKNEESMQFLEKVYKVATECL